MLVLFLETRKPKIYHNVKHGEELECYQYIKVPNVDKE
jgi:hypothetical protein